MAVCSRSNAQTYFASYIRKKKVVPNDLIQMCYLLYHASITLINRRKILAKRKTQKKNVCTQRYLSCHVVSVVQIVVVKCNYF